MASAFDQFKDFLREMFQYDTNDLDFGIFKILKLKRNYIEQFINGNGPDDLRATVARELARVENTDVEAAFMWLEPYCEDLGKRTREAWQALKQDPLNGELKARLEAAIDALDEDADKAESARERVALWVAGQTVSSATIEERLYNYLLNFFELYYQNGDFGYNSRAANAFKVPYEADYDGSDTFFHWKHKDSYYIKTGASFPSVKCEVAGKKLEFRLESGADREAEATAQNNNKDKEIKLYRLARIEEQEGVWQVVFHLAKAGTPKTELYPKLWATVFNDEADLAPYLFKKEVGDAAKPIFNDLAADFDKTDGGQVKGVNQLRLKEESYYKELAKRPEFSGLGRNEGERIEALKGNATAAALYQVDKALNQFFVGNDADYFIHKDLRGFLTREKDRFIKNVVFSDLDTLLNRNIDNTTLIIGRGFNAVATRIIEFLDALETFQRNIFTLKKKVIDTHWLISVGKIPERFHGDIAANAGQVRQFAEMYGVTIGSAGQLKEHPTLVVDTSFFDGEWTLELLSDPVFDNLDEQTDGVLIHSENWQALNLLQEKYREKVKCIYIDPPYNTGGDGFLYKDSFRHSSWAAMMADRLQLAHALLNRDGVLFASSDDKERTQLETLLKETFGAGNRVEELIWAQNSTKNQSPTYSNNHEYVQVFATDLERVKADPTMFREPKPGYAEMMELVERLNPDYPSIAEIEKAIAELFEQHRQEFRAELEEQGIEFDKNLDLWKGLYNYRNVEYRDAKGAYVLEAEAKEKKAKIWIWREGDASFPLGGGTAKKAGVYDPNHEDFRFYRPPHPVTKLECPHPKTGWRFPRNPVAGLATSFSEMAVDYRIAWGEDEKKTPQVKKFLHEVDTNVGRSVVVDYTDGEKELTSLTGKTRTFPNPKPTTLIERFVQQTTSTGEWMLDFFAGSGTTGHAVLRSDEQRRFMLTEMGDYFDAILKPRVKRVLYSTHWKEGAPVTPGRQLHVVKVQRLEQYEDLLANLETAWDGQTLPKGVPVQYLFRPEHNKLVASLDLSRPFSQKIKAGKAREERTIDLMESWLYLQGYWVKSRRRYVEGGRKYLAVETTIGVLVVFRDIDTGEDDSAALNAIVDRYKGENGEPTVIRLEVNCDADIRKVKLPVSLVQSSDFDRGASWS